MRTTGNELRSEAAIYAEGTMFTTDELVYGYNEYADALEYAGAADQVDDFQRWYEAEYA